MKRTVWFNIVTMILWAAAALFGPGTCTSVLAVEGTTPLYSFYNPTEHDHFLTASYDEEEQLRLFCDPAHRYVYEGICWRVETRPDRDTVPVYRFYNDLTKDHFFTISEDEKAALEKTLAAGTDHYVYEGIGWYAHASSGTAVYRLFNPVTFDHYYTVNTDDRDAMVSQQGYEYEGIAWYEQQTGALYPDNSGYPYTGTCSGQIGLSTGIESSYTWNSSSGGNSGQRTRSDEEIAELLRQYLSQYNTHWYHSFAGEPEMDWGTFFGVAMYGHQTQSWYSYSNDGARQPAGDELWCYISAAAGDGVMPIGNVYVNVYTGYVDATAVDNWNGASVPSAFYLW